MTEEQKRRIIHLATIISGILKTLCPHVTIIITDGHVKMVEDNFCIPLE